MNSNELLLLFFKHGTQPKWLFCLVNTMYNTIVKNNTFKKVYESIVQYYLTEKASL
jgi:hypothetical protein